MATSEQSLRERVLEAMQKSLRSRVFEVLEQREMMIDAKECIDLIRSLERESDRAVPIVLFGYLDGLLVGLFEAELNPSIPGGASSLLDGMAPLSTASSRINVAQGFYWISDQVADQLRLLKSIRNEFAHNPYTTFDAPKVQGWIASNEMYMGILRGTRGGDEPGLESDEDGREWVIDIDTVEGIRDGKLVRTPRLDFVISVVLTLHLAVLQMYVSPTAWRLGVHPGEMMAHKDEWPEDMIRFDASVGEFIDAAYWQEGKRQGRID